MAVSTYRAFKLGSLATTTFNNILNTDISSRKLILVLSGGRAMLIITAVTSNDVAI
jgi:hypothetical protein